MAISEVGTATASRTTDGSLTLTWPAGIQANDALYVGVSVGAVGDTNFSLTTTGYTKIADIYANGVPGWESGLAIFRKFTDGSDTEAVFPGHGGHPSGGIAMAGIILRGVNQTTPEDVAVVTALVTDNIPDCGSITPVTANTLILAFGGGWHTAEDPTAPSGYGSLAFKQGYGGWDYGTIALATKALAVAAAEDPAAFGNISNVARGACAVTIAARPASASVTAALTGTMASSANETSVRVGGGTIVLTLTGDTWVASGATFNAQRQAIIDGIDSAQAEAAGWDATVKALQGVSGVVRTSDTVVTITLDAQAGYQITAQETITATIPSAALTGAGGAVTAAPTFTIDTITESTGGAKNMLLLGVG